MGAQQAARDRLRAPQRHGRVGIVEAAGKKAFDWTDIVLLGLIVGAPTCLGTLLSRGESSPYATIVFYTLAAGSLLYMILSLATIAYTATRRLQVALGSLPGNQPHVRVRDGVVTDIRHPKLKRVPKSIR